MQDESNGLLDDTESPRTRLTASLKDILRRSYVVDVDADEGPVSAVGAWRGVDILSGCTLLESVWFIFLLISQVSCKISSGKE